MGNCTDKQGNPCQCLKTNTDNVSYAGPTLSCLGVTTNDLLTSIIQEIDFKLCNSGVQNNFVRQLFIAEADLPASYTLQDICDYILALPPAERTVAQTDSKWNVIIRDGMSLEILSIYEIQNIGEGVITVILPDNLLLLNDSSSTLQDVLEAGNTTTLDAIFNGDSFNPQLQATLGAFGGLYLTDSINNLATRVDNTGIVASDVPNNLLTSLNAGGITFNTDLLRRNGLSSGSTIINLPATNGTQVTLATTDDIVSTPDATDTIKGKLRLTNDLGGTADAPTTPTAIHITGNEVKTGTLTVTSIIVPAASGFLKVNGVIDTTVYAPLNSPGFTGIPTAPTAADGNNTTQLATTAFVTNAITIAAVPDATTLVKGKIKLAGDLSGTADLPTVPELTLKENIANKQNSLAVDGSGIKYPTVDAVNNALVLKADLTYVNAQLALKAPLASPALTGVPTAPTAPLGTNTTQLATTAFVLSNAIQNQGTGAQTANFWINGNGRLDGTLTLGTAPVTSAGTFDVLTRNTTTGAVEKVLSSLFALDTNVVHKTGNESIAGIKTFTTNVETVQLTMTGANPFITFPFNAPLLSTFSRPAINAENDKLAIHSSTSLSNMGALLDTSLLLTTDKTFTFPNQSGTFALTSDLSIYELIANKQNNLNYDGTGIKYPTVDAVNNLSRNILKTASKTGVLTKLDTFNLTALDDFTARIAAVETAVFWNELFVASTAPSAAIRSFIQKDYPLNQLLTPTGGNVNITPLTTDGKYVRYLGYDKNGNVFSDANSFFSNNDILQIGFVTILKVGSTISFLDGAAGPRNVFAQPNVASNTDFDKVSGVVVNVTAFPNAVASIGTSNGSLTGISINWKSSVNPANSNPIDVFPYVGQATAVFRNINPLYLTAIPELSTHTLWTELEGGIAINNRFFNTTTQLADTMAAGTASVKRILIGIRGGIYVQDGEHANTACYPDLTTAKNNISSHKFTQAVLPEGTAFEIARVAYVKGASVFTNDAQFYILNTAGSSSSSSSSVPAVSDATTVTKGILKLAGDLSGTADLPTVPALANKINGSGSGITDRVAKWTNTTTLGLSNITDTGTLITLASATRINGNVSLNAVISASQNLVVGGNITGNTTSVALMNQGVVQSDVTGAAYYYRSNISTQATAFTLNALVHYNATQLIIGAGSTVTFQYGFHASPSLIGATNNYGFKGEIPEGANRWNVYMDGTAANHFNGNVLIGTTTDDGATKLQVNSTAVIGLDTSTSPFLAINGAAGNNRSIFFRTAGVLRWGIREDNAAESGSNAGSNFRIASYSDAGAFITEAVTILRSNGNVGIGSSVPTLPLEVAATGGAISIKGKAVGDSIYMSYYNSAGTRRGFIGYGNTSSGVLSIVNEETDGHIRIGTNGTGNVGINTATPFTKTHIVSTSAGNPVDALTIQNTSATANTETGIFFAPAATVDNTRGARITAINDGSNGISLKLWTGSGATISSKLQIGSTGIVTINNLSGGAASKIVTADASGNLSAGGDLSGYAPLNSPAFTGTPTAPTAALNTNNTQLATTAFVVAQIADDAPTKTGGGASGTWAISISGNAATVTTNANLTGEVTSIGNATTMGNNFVIAKVLSGFVSGAGVVSSSDSIVAAIGKLDGNIAGKANIASPSFTGDPKSITPPVGDNDTSIATTAYVVAEIASRAPTKPVPVADGGTGITSYAAGDILYASGTTVLAKLPAAATGNVLLSGTSPSWGKVGLTTHVSGILPIANGGTNTNVTPTAGAVAYGTGTAYAFSAQGATGQFLKTGVAAAPTWVTLSLTDIPGSSYKEAVKAATTATLAATYANGTAGVGATLTASTLVALPAQDGVTLIVGDRLLVKNQSTTFQNGIYTVTVVGVAATTAWVLTRATDADSAGELAGGTVNVDSGTLNGGNLYTTALKSTDTIGTTAVNWYKILDESNLLTSGSTAIGAVKYNGTTPLAGAFDGSSTMPSASNRLNYDGNFYANSFTGTRLISTIATGTAPLTVTSQTKVDNLFSEFSNIVTDVSGARIVNPQGGSSTGNASSVTGAIKITLPIGYTNNMMKFTVSVFDYTTGEAFDVVIAGYNAGAPSSVWANCSAYIVSQNNVDRRFAVRFGITAGGKCCVYIGEITSVWAYPQIYIKDITSGHTGISGAASLLTGWSVGFEATAFETVTVTVPSTSTQVNYAQTGNVANSTVYRDGSGNFSAGVITATGLNLSAVADTATAASHYYVETASDSLVRPKTLANVQAEIVTNAAALAALPGAALTKVDDTNITLTLGGSATTSLLRAASITAGWTGTLADARIASAANWNTAYTNRITSLTTTGSSGAATLLANVLNIPNYTLAGLGGINFASVISGYVLGANTALDNTITLDVALERIQGQINARTSGVAGTAGAIPKFTAAGTIGNTSFMTENATGIGIGVAATQKLDVSGNARVFGTNVQIAVHNATGKGGRVAAASGVDAFCTGTVDGDMVIIATSGQRIFLTVDPGGTPVNINGAGQVTAAGFFNYSDAREKEVISRNGDAVTYKWKDKRDDVTHVGYLAQEVQEYMPDAVNKDNNGMLSVNYIEVLVSKIAQLEKRIVELESKLK